MKQAFKKYLTKSALLSLEIIAILTAVALIGVVILGLRMQVAPLKIDFMTPVITEMLNQNEAELRFEVGSTTLEWRSFSRPVDIVVQDLKIRSVHNFDVATIQEMGLSLSLRSLLFGKLRPVRFSLTKPDIFFYRDREGNITVDLAKREKEKKDEVDVIADKEKKERSTRLVMRVIRGLIDKKRKNSLLGQLEIFEISEAKILFADLQNDQFWDVPGANIVIIRDDDGLQASGDLHVLHDDGEFDVKTHINHGYDFTTADEADTVTQADLDVKGFNAKILVDNFAKMKILSGTDGIFDADVTLSFRNKFEFEDMQANVKMTSGQITIDHVLPKPLRIETLDANIHFDPEQNMFLADHIEVSTEDVRFVVNADLDLSGEEPLAQIRAAFKSFNAEKLGEYWPADAAQNAREWVIPNIKTGMVEDGVVAVQGFIRKDAEGKRSFDLSGLAGQFDFRGLRVDYLSPLPPATQLAGTARFDLEGFEFDVLNGQVGGINFGRSDIKITGLDIEEEAITIKVGHLNGQLVDLAKILDSEPLGYIKEIDLTPADFSGIFTGELTLEFPLLNDLLFEHVTIKAKGQGKNVAIQKLFEGQALQNATVDFDVTSDRLLFSGVGELAEAKLEKFSYEYRLDESQPYETKMSGIAVGSEKTLQLLDIPLDEYVKGAIRVDLAMTEKANGIGDLKLKADLKEAELNIPYISVAKPAGQEMLASTNIALEKGRLSKLDNLVFKGDSLEAKGTMQAAYQGDEVYFSRMEFPVIRSEKNDFSLIASGKAPDRYLVLIEGKKMDAAHFLDDENDASKDNASKDEANKDDEGLALVLSLKLDELHAVENTKLDKLFAYIDMNRDESFNRFEIDANTPKGMIKVRYHVDGDRETLKVRGTDAGYSLKALGGSSEIKGGQIFIDADTHVSTQTGEKRLQGKMLMRNFKVIKVPVLARIINALSFEGLTELLGRGEGLAFERLSASFVWRNQDKQKIVTVLDSAGAGASLGLIFKGKVNLTTDHIDGEGTIVPVSGINNMLSNLPIIGSILSGGSNAVFAATYGVKGNMDEPDVSVNPLAALTPGFLRQIFFEGEKTAEEEKAFKPIEDKPRARPFE